MSFASTPRRPKRVTESSKLLITGETLCIVSPKPQTTRHRILGVLTEKNYQLVFSDTPGMMEPVYKLQEAMMDSVR